MTAWRADWAEWKAGANCPMCAEGRPTVNPWGVRVFRGEVSDALLQRVEHALGYTIVIFRGRHVSEVTELTDDESARFWREIVVVARAIERQYRPAKLNIALYGNATPHLHAHIVPRYLDDGYPAGPFPFPERGAPLQAEERFRPQVESLRAALGENGQGEARSAP